jgi:hypothetical protein
MDRIARIGLTRMEDKRIIPSIPFIPVNFLFHPVDPVHPV